LRSASPVVVPGITGQQHARTVGANDDAAVKAYTAALPHHDSPDAVQFSLERAERRLQRGSPVNPRNTAAVWDRGYAQRRASAQ